MDFTKETYQTLTNTLQKQGFLFQTFADFIEKPMERALIFRHDVDKLPLNSLEFARIQAEAGIRGTYYFRAVQESWDEKLIKEIYSLGHEIGYHYEDLSFAQAKLKAQGKGRRAEGEELERKLVDIGIKSFSENLEELRKIVPVETICMHGSPMSRWDSRLLWKYYDYRDFGIIGEPYFDVNFNEVLYLTDTGRRWDGSSVNIRDKASGISTFAKATDFVRRSGLRPTKAEDKGGGDWEIPSMYTNWKVKPVPGSLMNMTPAAIDFQSKYKFRSTFDIIKAAEEGSLPDKIMMTFHPQRWTNKPIPWMRELVWQNVKNAGKYFLVKVNSE